VRLIEERVYVLPETRAIARALDVDPLATLASGALLVGVAPADAHRLVDAFAARGIRADLVGEVLPAAEGLAIERGGERQPLLVPARDEVARVLETGV
jgi:hydrogenase maturation factor